jgi:hypothetical protein
MRRFPSRHTHTWTELFKFGLYLKALPLAEFHFKFERPYKIGRDPHVRVTYTFVKAPLKIEKFFT